MCGIAGSWDEASAERSLALLPRMLESMAHRGPDARGSWAEGPVSLGHLRLSILDPSERANQPLATEDGGSVLSYNGEVYNFRALRAELEREGARFGTGSDTEVVLQALQRWGPRETLPRLDGMFALAWFDRRRGELWLARDRWGMKPLYFSQRGGLLRFASEIKALLEDPEQPRQADPALLLHHLADGQIAGPWTLFQGIEALEPGALLRIHAGGTERARWVDRFHGLDVERLAAASLRPEQELVGELDALMEESVALHLASDVPLGAMCSGGVDSGLVAAIARERYPKLQAYVADVEGEETESLMAARTGAHLDVPLHAVPFDVGALVRHWPEAVWLSDSPTYHTSDIALLSISKRCRRDGIKVLLTGEGSDELFAGYPRYVDSVRRLRRWRPRSGAERLRALFSRGRFLRKDPVRIGRQIVIPRPGPPTGPERERAFLRRSFYERLAPLRSSPGRALLTICLEDLGWNLQRLLKRMDRMGMGASVEARLPFLENRLVDFAVHVPHELKRREGEGKWIVKEVAAKRLPHEVVYAPKRAFPIPFEPVGSERLVAGGALGELLGWTTARTETFSRALAGDRHARLRWVSAELWARIFLRGESREELREELVALGPGSTPGPAA